MRGPGKSEAYVLEAAQRNAKFGWLLSTSTKIPLRVVQRLVSKGWLRELPELGCLVDGDGFTIQPERWRVCYELTDNGRAALEALSVKPQGDPHA